MTTDTKNRSADEAERYRRAAEETLGQLQWCINYLHRIRKSALADALARNHALISRRMREPGR